MLKAATGPQDDYAALRSDWQGKTKADPDFTSHVSGDKTGLDAVKLDIGKALNALGNPKLAADFRAAMDLTGAGDHPAVVKTLLKLSAFITEGTHVSGRGPSTLGQQAPGTTARPTHAKALYPNNP
jgi:hypothetical protein